MSKVCVTDGSFGPGAGSCRGGFDFSLLFEDSILGLVPQAAFLLLAPVRLATLRRRRHRVTKRSHLGFLKLVTSIGYVFASVILLAMWSELETFKTKFAIASASLEFLVALAVVVLSRLEHTRAVRPSHLLQFFLLVLLLCEAVRLRTLFLVDYPTSLVTPASIHAFLTGLLLLLESLDKRELFASDSDRTLAPEETVGLFGKRLIWYLNDLFRDGYGKVLKPDDLTKVDADLTSKERNIRFIETWNKKNQSTTEPLAKTIWSVLWLDILLPVVPRLLQMATTLSQPYLITAMIKFVQGAGDQRNANHGYGLILAFALNYSILAISSAWCAQATARFSTKLRACLISLLYDSTLSVDPKNVDLGSATVLMNIDTEKLLHIVRYVHEFWAVTISLGVALYVLYTHLGAAFIAPFLTTLVAAGLCGWLGKYMGPLMLTWASATEKRVTTIAYIAACIKGIRMLGLTNTVHKILTGLREAEVAAHGGVRRLLVWVIVISNVMFQLTTCATYVTYTITILTKAGGSSFNYNALYGSLSALKLVTSPLVEVLQLIPAFQSGLVSLHRIERFAQGKPIDDSPETAPTDNVEADDIELLPVKSHGASKIPGTNLAVFSMANASFSINDKLILSNLNLSVPKGSFTMVLGKVGTGKSILLRSIIRETKLVSGSYNSPSLGISFCDQTVWLRNDTIRGNIIGEDQFNEDWYREVLWSCGLHQDVAEMKQSDMTLVGSKGISLSGGQKNRIALARALYARKPLLVIDDMLAGLDNKTEKLVIDRVFGHRGILRRINATLVLATHSTHVARNVDQVIVLSGGKITESGTYQELLDNGINLHKYSERNENEQDPDLSNEDRSYESFGNLATPSAADGDEDTEDAARLSGDRKSLSFFLNSVGRFHCSLSFFLLTVTVAATTIQLLWLKWWADLDNPSKSDTIRNLYLFIIITAINILLFLVFVGHYVLWFVPRSSLSLHAAQLIAFMHAKFSFLVSTDIGNITNRFSQDIVMVDNELQYSWLNLAFFIFSVMGSIGILIAATPPVAGVIPLLGVVGYCIQRIYLRTSRQLRLMDLEAKAPLCTHFLESLAGIVTIRSFGWSSAYKEKNDKYLDQSQVPFYLLFSIQNWLSLVLQLVVAGLITVIVGLAVGLRSKVDPGYLGLALVAAMDLGWYFQLIIRNWTEFETCLSAVTRIRQFSQAPSEIQDHVQPDPPESWPALGSVQFKDLAAGYSEDGKPVLTDVTLNIKAGEKIGICGRTGSGKSSLVATLFGLLHEKDGSILIDNIRTTDVSLSVLRSKIVSLPQEPFFLRGTVRHNLAPWSDDAKRRALSDEELISALEQVKLWEKLNNAAGDSQSVLDMSLDNVDSLLSQGERQLFCLARSILMDGKIVVLDEATSSVDTQTDALMQRIFRTAFADRTIIAIAHRLDTILDFDRVVVMDAGRVAEVGQPEVLMQTEGSLFKGLVESQGGSR